MKKYIYIVLLVFFGLLVFSTCNLETEKGFHFDEKKFNSEWNKWTEKNIQDYSFTLNGKLPYWNFSRAIPMLEYEVNIIVKNGEMESFEYIGEIPHDENDENSVFEPEFTSISDLYQKISDRSREEKEWWNNYSGNGHILSTEYVIKYNSELNYVTFFEPVSNWKSNVEVDTTAHAISISKFVVLE